MSQVAIVLSIESAKKFKGIIAIGAIAKIELASGEKIEGVIIKKRKIRSQPLYGIGIKTD